MESLAFLMLAALLASAPAPTPGIWQAVASASRHPLELKDGRLPGEGFDFLMKELETSQLVVLGEEHNTAEIPPFTAALFRALHDRLGYQYFAEEQDPLIMERASTKPARGNKAALEELAEKYRYAF